MEPILSNALYFKMSMKYHPDRNPEGRDMFEKVNQAYEFLNSKSMREMAAGPRESNLHLLIKSQVILFSRLGEELRDYKYAGYPMLIKTIQRVRYVMKQRPFSICHVMKQQTVSTF